MASVWTVAKILTTWRNLTGRKSTNQISDSGILDYLNMYWQYILPVETITPELKGWYTFNTTASTGSKDINDQLFSIMNPVYVNDVEVTLWTDEKRFYEEYPLDYDTEDVPTDLLLFDRSIIMRPIPDDSYEVRLRAQKLVSAITASDLPFTFDESPYIGLWAPAVAYGGAVIYLSEKGESELVAELSPIYQYFIDLLRQYAIKQQPVGRRPPGGRF